MMGLPSLQAMDRAQGARIWMASEATDMRCKESIESNPGLTIRLRPFFSRAQHSRHRTKSHLAIVNAMRHCYTLMAGQCTISGQQDDANTPVAHFDTDCRARSSPAS